MVLRVSKRFDAIRVSFIVNLFCFTRTGCGKPRASSFTIVSHCWRQERGTGRLARGASFADLSHAGQESTLGFMKRLWAVYAILLPVLSVVQAQPAPSATASARRFK